jgi:hypothetical protein
MILTKHDYNVYFHPKKIKEYPTQTITLNFKNKP